MCGWALPTAPTPRAARARRFGQLAEQILRVNGADGVRPTRRRSRAIC
jgi:hypothetical protein